MLAEKWGCREIGRKLMKDTGNRGVAKKSGRVALEDAEKKLWSRERKG